MSSNGTEVPAASTDSASFETGTRLGTWIGVLTDGNYPDTGLRFRDGTIFDCVKVLGSGRNFYLFVEQKRATPSLSYTASAEIGAVFDGIVYNRGELISDLDVSLSLSNAEILLILYSRYGETLLEKLKGVYTFAIFDRRHDTLLCARDHLGINPLFYYQDNDGFYIAPLRQTLVQHPRVSTRPDAVDLANWLTSPYVMEETLWEGVKRLPPGHALHLRGNSKEIFRYWDMVEPDGSIDWIPDADAEEVFNDTLAKVTRYYLNVGPSAIFLSGGIDSVSIAAITMQEARASGQPLPLALSLVFPDDANEEEVQRGVAERLGLSQHILPLYTAAGSENLVGAGIELSRRWSRPVLNTWWPAYHTLALEAKRRGSEVILTGSGGDYWLNIDPIIAADYVKSANIRGLFQITLARQFAYDARLRDAAKEVLWKYGFRALAVDFATRAGLRDRIKQPKLTSLPTWLGSTPDMREQIYQRRETILLERYSEYTVPTHGFYVRSIGHSLENAWSMGIIEHFFEAGQQLGIRFLHPYWDPDLIRMLVRMSPKALLLGRRTKGLVRDSIARRFPQLSFRNQRKITSAYTFDTILLRNALDEWRKLGGAPALAELGVINPEALTPYVEELLTRTRLSPRKAGAMWVLLTLEAWLQSHWS